MTEIFILGAGVMGTALAVPAAERANNHVTLVGSPLDDASVQAVHDTGHHPSLRAPVPDTINTIKLSQLDTAALAKADIIIIGVSSPGMQWVIDLLREASAKPALLALVTKGLVDNPDSHAPPLTYADSLLRELPQMAGRLVGIGGPCIARELALRIPTRVTFASRNIDHARELQSLLQTDYYRITTHTNIVAVEACAALKNFLCIGVSAMISAYPLDESHAKNPVAALFNQAVLELLILSRWISTPPDSKSGSMPGSIFGAVPDSRPDSASAGKPVSAPGATPAETHSAQSDVAFDLAGMGDLHVTVGGGRNSRLGTFLGQGRSLKAIIETDMAGVTVEGVDTGRRLFPGLLAACSAGILAPESLPLSRAILQCIQHDALFDFDFAHLPS